MGKVHSNLVLSGLMLLSIFTIFLMGCTETIPGIPFTASQYISKVTDLNYTLFSQGFYDGNCLKMDGNKISVGSCFSVDANIPWNQLINFPAGCGANQAVKIVGSSLVCIDLPVDTNCAVSGSCSLVAYLDRNSNFDSGTLFVDASNNKIGIGTATPTNTFSVSGGNSLINAVFSGYAPLTGNSADTGSISIASNPAYQGIIQYTAADATTFSIDNTFNNSGAVTQFRMRTAGTPVTALTILGSGNVGIGTTVPSSKLDVNVSSALDGITLSKSGTVIGNILYGGDGTGSAINLNDSSGNTTAKLRGYSVSGVQAYFTSGNVGIGTASPSDLLHLLSGTGDVNESINAGSNKNSMLKLLESGSGDVGTYLKYDGNANRFGIWMGNNPPLERVSILRDNGNVGIGTTAPQNRLYVAGTAKSHAIASEMGFDLNYVPNPPYPVGSATLVDTNTGNVDVGKHFYFMSYTTAIGETSIGWITISTTPIVTDANHKKVLLGIPVSSDTRVTGRKIYRTKASDGDCYSCTWYMTTINNNTDTNYTDNIADSSLTGPSGTGYSRANTTNYGIMMNGTQAIVVDEKATVVGKSALDHQTSGGRSIGIGYNAGTAVTSGSEEVLIGENSGSSITTGGWNTAIGVYTLAGNSSGSDNTAVGNRVAQNTASGSYSGTTLIGSHAGFNINTNSSYSTALGYYSGYSLQGANNIFLGNYSGYYETGGSKLIVDSFFRSTEALGRSSALIYGTMSATPSAQTLTLGGGGKVGIGTQTPNTPLHIQSATDATQTIQSDSTTTGTMAKLQFKLTTNTDNNYYFAGIGAERQSDTLAKLYLMTQPSAGPLDASDAKLTIDKDGNVGIGTTTPTNKLNIAGDVNATGNYIKNGLTGLTRRLNLTQFGGAQCYVDVNGGIITDSNC